jgi:phosphonate transport system permease protein
MPMPRTPSPPTADTLAPPVDPGSPQRRALAWAGCAALALVVASFASLDLHWAEFAAPDALARMGRFGASFFPPETSPAFLRKTFSACAETFAMSLLGTGIATGAGLALALPAAQHHSVARHAARILLNALRSIPELVWASLLLISAGLGPFPGTLALALHTAGVLGRLFAESLENAAPGPAAALRIRGVGAARVFLWATLPQVAPQLLSYALYRWENNVRAAAVLGVVGAGGLGQMLAFHLGLFQMHETCTVLLAMVVLVTGVDALSNGLRRRMTR